MKKLLLAIFGSLLLVLSEAITEATLGAPETFKLG